MTQIHPLFTSFSTGIQRNPSVLEHPSPCLAIYTVPLNSYEWTIPEPHVIARLLFSKHTCVNIFPCIRWVIIWDVCIIVLSVSEMFSTVRAPNFVHRLCILIFCTNKVTIHIPNNIHMAKTRYWEIKNLFGKTKEFLRPFMLYEN